MTEEQKQPEQTEKTQSATAEAWREVGKQFETLGKSLAAATRAAWQDETNRRHLQEMQDELEKMADEVGRAIKSAAAAVDDEKVKASAKQAAHSVRAAGEQTAQEARPYLVNALRQTRDGIQKIIAKLEEEETKGQ